MTVYDRNAVGGEENFLDCENEISRLIIRRCFPQPRDLLVLGPNGAVGFEYLESIGKELIQSVRVALSIKPGPDNDFFSVSAAASFSRSLAVAPGMASPLPHARTASAISTFLIVFSKSPSTSPAADASSHPNVQASLGRLLLAVNRSSGDSMLSDCY